MRMIVMTLVLLFVTPGPRDRYAFRYAVDGDTIDVAGIGRVRLLGIDAPEIGAGMDTPAPFAREARDHLASLLVTRWLRLEMDGEQRDRYARLLAYVVREDGLFVNAEMLRAGLARVSARVPLRRLPELKAAERAAQQSRLGIWGGRPSLPVESYRVPRR
ncbi:MAG TPA: thermonuclease family protein [Vicinamibacterales bacterium]|nr:thermonuclease family protein [Vicinamibacterales bacterium]